MAKLYRVPPSFALFAILGDNEDRDAEWGVPEPARIDRHRAFYYEPRYAANVLECLEDVATALSMGSDCTREAGRILAWVRRERARLGIKA